MELGGLVHIDHGGDNGFMTITFRGQKSVPAVLLAYEHDKLRVLIPGEQDTNALQRVNGVWVSTWSFWSFFWGAVWAG